MPALRFKQALWVVSHRAAEEEGDLGGDALAALRQALLRMDVQAARLGRVVLTETPALAARYRVRVTPCIALVSGDSVLHLPGHPQDLGPAQLDAALMRR